MRGAPFEQQRTDLPRGQTFQRRAERVVGGDLDLRPARFERRCAGRHDCAAAAVVTIMTGPASGVESTRAVGGVRSRRSNTTRDERPLPERAARRQIADRR